MKQSYDFPADTSVLERIGEIAAEIGEKAGFNEAEIADIQLALDEACTNTIIHGLKCDPSHTFQLVIEWKQDEIELVIYETGTPYNPVLIEDPDITAPLEKRPVGGLGI
jgi:serine/threonine-protein kinase RsbW